MMPLQFTGHQPLFNRSFHHFHEIQLAQMRQPDPDRSLHRQFPSTTLPFQFPKGYGANNTTLFPCHARIQEIAGDWRKLAGIHQPPKQHMRVDYHGLWSSSRRTSQRSAGSGFSSASSSIGPFGLARARSSANISSFDCLPFIGRTSKTSRPRSVTTSGSPVASISRKYSNILAFSLPLETVFMNPI